MKFIHLFSYLFWLTIYEHERRLAKIICPGHFFWTLISAKPGYMIQWQVNCFFPSSFSQWRFLSSFSCLVGPLCFLWERFENFPNFPRIPHGKSSVICSYRFSWSIKAGSDVVMTINLRVPELDPRHHVTSASSSTPHPNGDFGLRECKSNEKTMWKIFNSNPYREVQCNCRVDL